MDYYINLVSSLIKEFISDKKSYIMDFWFMNPVNLFKSYDLMPNKNMNRSDFANCIMRLGLYLGFIMLILGISIKSILIFIIIIGALSIVITGGLVPDDVEHFQSLENNNNDNIISDYIINNLLSPNFEDIKEDEYKLEHNIDEINHNVDAINHNIDEFNHNVDEHLKDNSYDIDTVEQNSFYKLNNSDITLQNDNSDVTLQNDNSDITLQDDNSDVTLQNDHNADNNNINDSEYNLIIDEEDIEMNDDNIGDDDVYIEEDEDYLYHKGDIIDSNEEIIMENDKNNSYYEDDFSVESDSEYKLEDY